MNRYLIRAHVLRGAIELSRLEEMAKILKGIYGDISFSVEGNGRRMMLCGFFNGEEIDGVTYEDSLREDTEFGYYEIMLIGKAI